LCQIFDAAPPRLAQPRKTHFEDDNIGEAKVDEVPVNRSIDRQDLPVVVETVVNIIPTGSQLPRTPHIKVNKEDVSLSSTTSSPISDAFSARNSPNLESSEVQSGEKSDLLVSTNIDESQARCVRESDIDPLPAVEVVHNDIGEKENPPLEDILPEDFKLVEPAAVPQLSEGSANGSKSGQILTEKETKLESGQNDKSFHSVGNVFQTNLATMKTSIKSSQSESPLASNQVKESKPEASSPLSTENKMKQEIVVKKTKNKNSDVQGGDDMSAPALNVQAADKSALASQFQGADDRSTLTETLDVKTTEKAKPKQRYVPQKQQKPTVRTENVTLSAASEQDEIETVKSGEGGDGADDSLARATRTRRGNAKLQPDVVIGPTKKRTSEDTNVATSYEKIHSPRKQNKKNVNEITAHSDVTEDIGKQSERKVKTVEQPLVVVVDNVETVTAPDVSEPLKRDSRGKKPNSRAATENDVTGSNDSRDSSMATKKSGRGKKNLEETKLSETSKAKENADKSIPPPGRSKRVAKPEETKETEHETTRNIKAESLSSQVVALEKSSRTRRAYKASGI